MFEFNLMARHAPSGEAFVVALHSLPSIKKLLEDIQSVVEEEYQQLAFPSIPDLFLTQEDLPQSLSTLVTHLFPLPCL